MVVLSKFVQSSKQKKKKSKKKEKDKSQTISSKVVPTIFQSFSWIKLLRYDGIRHPIRWEKTQNQCDCQHELPRIKKTRQKIKII